MALPVLPNELLLLQQMIEGDAMAFRKIYEFYRGRIFAYAFSYTKSANMAEEAVQEIFIRLWEKRGLLQTDKNFEAYIKVATRNQIFNMLRKVALDRVLQQKIHGYMVALQHTSADELLAKELERLHQLAVHNLPLQQKQVYKLSREEELSYEQIADKLNISKHTVKRHMAEALKTLRNQVGRHTDTGSIIIAILLSKK